MDFQKFPHFRYNRVHSALESATAPCGGLVGRHGLCNHEIEHRCLAHSTLNNDHPPACKVEMIYRLIEEEIIDSSKINCLTTMKLTSHRNASDHRQNINY